MEFLGWKKLTGFAEQQAAEFLKTARIILMDKKTEDVVIRILKNHSTPLPDAIIAATAIRHQLTLVTRDTDDFQGISGLLLYDPFLS